MRLVFMGTPDFAVPSLTALHQAGHEIAAVYTQPDRPTGRGRKTTVPPVKQRALELGLPVRQPLQVNAPQSLDELRALACELFVVVAYGFILSPELLAVPKRGAINLHASLLPDYRGASPIAHVLLDGARETGVSTIWMDEGIDTGDVILQERVTIEPEENAGDLAGRLAAEGADLLVRTVAGVADGTAPRTPQDRGAGKYCRKLRKDAGRIDWTRGAEAIARHVRAMNPWPGAIAQLTEVAGEPLAEPVPVRIERARIASRSDGTTDPGSLRREQSATGGAAILCDCGDGTLELLEVRPAGKRTMRALDWWRGLRADHARFAAQSPDPA